jgi:hypothetical protein
MAMLAMWFQQSSISGGNLNVLLVVFIGLVAVSMIVQAIVLIAVAVTAGKTIRQLNETAEEFRAKLLPLIDSGVKLSRSAEDLLSYTSPKVKIIADNMLETSEVVRSSARGFDKTMTDVNLRTQRQVARVDSMVTAALTTTAEIAETIQEGIRVPVQKIALIVTQVRLTVEGIVARVKSKAAKSPFGSDYR